jgi:hypothetical protein
MAQLKRNFRVCTAQVACDGADLIGSQEACSACREKMRRRLRDAEKRKQSENPELLPRRARERVQQIQKALGGAES